MTREEELDWLCRLRSAIYVYMPKEWLIPMKNALDMAIKALEQEPCDNTVSRGVFEQVMWERDTAIEQLRELGYDLGQKIEPCDDCVSRQAVMKLLNKRYCHKEPYERKEGNTVYKGYDTYYMINFDKLKALPSVIPKREQGKWIQNGTGYDDEPIYKCSQCGKRVTFWEDGSFNGCPYCFAEMR